MSELDIGAADHADRFDDPIGVFLQSGLQFRVDCQHRRHAEGIACVNAHGIDVFDEADGDHLVLGVADHLQFQLFPSEDRFFDEDLADHARCQPAICDQTQLLDVVDMAAAGAAQRVRGADHDWVAQIRRDALGLLDAEGGRAPWHVDAQALHRFFENDPVFAFLDRVGFDPDDADAVAGQHARLGQLRREVEPGLAAEVGQQGVGPLFLDDFRQGRKRQRLDVRHVGGAGISHDRGRVRVHQHDLVTHAAQRLARLGAGVVEFAGLPNHNGPGANDENFVDVGSFRHNGRRRIKWLRQARAQ